MTRRQELLSDLSREAHEMSKSVRRHIEATQAAKASGEQETDRAEAVKQIASEALQRLERRWPWKR